LIDNSLFYESPGLPKDGLDLIRLRDVMNGIENFFEAVDASFTSLAESAAKEAWEYGFRTEPAKGLRNNPNRTFRIITVKK